MVGAATWREPDALHPHAGAQWLVQLGPVLNVIPTPTHPKNPRSRNSPSNAALSSAKRSGSYLILLV